MYKKVSIIFLILFSGSLLLCSQNEKIDSLLDLYKNTSSENEQIEILKDVSMSFMYTRDYEQTIRYAQKGLDITRKNNDKNNELEFLEIFAECFYHNSKYEESLKYYNLIYKLSEDNKNLKKKGVAFYGFSKNYWRKGMHDEAIYFETEAIKIFENIGDTLNVNLAKGNLGTIYLDIGDYDRADIIYDEVLQNFQIANDTFGMANVYEKKGAVKFFKGYYPYARKYYYKAYELYEKKGMKMEVAIEMGNIGETYEMEGNYKKAIELYKQAIKTENEYKYYSGLIFLNQALGRSYHKIEKYKKAKKAYLISLEYINKVGEYRELINIYRLLHELFNKTGDYKNAYKYSLMTMHTKDSITGVNVQNQINEIRIKYESEKKEKENDLLKNNQVLQEQVINIQKMENRRQLFIIITISVLLLSIVIFSVLIVRFNKRNKEIGLRLKNKNSLLSEAYTDIKYSIEYAGKIQNAMLVFFEEVKHNFSDYTIFYKPSSVLSGDFYWSKKINDMIFVVVADSTGHGVPGALLSITGMSFLNEIVTEDFIQTDTILNNLRDKIKKLLNKKGNPYEIKDGWDMSVFAYNHKTKEVQFSGAYNSLYVISGKGENKIMKKYKADRQPVGVYYNEQPFKALNLKVESGDIIWLFTDGYADQFNERVNKKYSAKRLRNMLLSISDKSLVEQNKIITKEFEDWKGSYDQIDDILVTGIKI